MDCSQLTEVRLYAIMKNEALNVAIRTAAEDELKHRNLSSIEMEAIIHAYEESLSEKNDKDNEPESLNLRREALLWLNPIQFPFWGWANINSKLQQKGREKQRRKFMFYLCSVILLITIIVILWAKMLMVKAVD